MTDEIEDSNTKNPDAEETLSKAQNGSKRKSIKFYSGGSCRYEVVRAAASKLGWKLVDDPSSVNVLWIDTSNVRNFLNSIKPWQRINHFPGMSNIARKTRLADNLGMMKKGFTNEYAFFPTTFILPRDLASIKTHFNSGGRSKFAFIVKPDGGCQGKGIFLTKSFDEIEEIKTTHVAQRYIPNPLLIDGKKFDLRIYVLITSCNPLRIYLFQDGLVRLCTEDFVQPNSGNMDDKCMHLTNYAINKRSDRFKGSNDESGESGSKRSIKWFLSWLRERKGLEVVDKLWEEIGDICAKTIFSILPILVREYNSTFGPSAFAGREEFTSEDGDECAKHNESKKEAFKSKENVVGSRCFSVLGVDIMIDSELSPYLIEVNHLPSFATGSPLDEAIKSKVCFQALSVLKCASSDQRNHEAGEKKRRRQRIQGSTVKSEGSNNFLPEQQNSVKTPKMTISTVVADDCSNVEEFVTEIYARYAPEKLDKVDALLQKYHGYEEWLVRRLEEKYLPLQASETVSDAEGEEKGSNDSPHDPTSSAARMKSTTNINANDIDLQEEHDILVEHGDYTRIYPPESKEKLSLYMKMQGHAGEHDKLEQNRLTCPMWLQRQQSQSQEEDTQVTTGHIDNENAVPSRGDWMFRGGGQQKKALVAKIIQPPSQKQIEAAERLSKGYSVEDTKLSCLKSIESTVNQTLKSEEFGKSCRRRNEGKYIQKTQLQMNPIKLEFESEQMCFRTAGERYYVDFAGRKIG